VCRRHRATPILISQRSDRRSQVRYTPWRAALFFDPAGFLKEAGFVVGEGLQADLNDLPGGEGEPLRPYEDFLAGKGRAATWRVQISSLR
jgi:hypothetical protein